MKNIDDMAEDIMTTKEHLTELHPLIIAMNSQ